MSQTPPKEGTAPGLPPPPSEALLQELDRKIRELEARNHELEVQVAALNQEQTRWHLNDGAVSRQQLEQIEQALQESETELRLITDAVPGLIAQVDRDQCYQFVNATYERWYGRSRDQIIGHTVREIVGPETYKRIRPHIEVALTGEQVTFETTFPYAAGEKTVLATYMPYLDLEGRPAGFYALIMDISIHKQMEEALRESEERFKVLANHAPALIWINGPDGQAEFVNQGYIDFTGRPMKALLGEEWIDLVHPVDVEGYLGDYEAAFELRQRFEADFRFRRADGEYRWMKSVGVPRYQDDGIFLGYIGCTFDIHDRKQAEQALQESESRFRIMADTAPVMIWMADMDKRTTYFNHHWLEFTGRSLSKELGFGWMESVHPHDYQRCLDTYVTAFEARQPFTMEYRLCRVDGVYRWIVDTGVPLFKDERFIGYIGSCHDIHERKRAELGERLLAEAGQVLSSSLDYTVRLSNVARLAVPHLADWCAVTLFNENWTVQHSTVAHIDPAKVTLARELQQRYPPRQDELAKAAQPWQSGQAELYPEITDAMLEAGAQDAEHFQIMRDLDLRSAMVVPLMVQQQVVGTMLFVWAESRNQYDEQDLVLAKELARRAAVALENARTYQAEQAARRVAEQFAERIATLQTVTTRLSQAVSSIQIAEVVLKQGLSAIGINAGMIAVLSDDGTEFELLASTGYFEQSMARWQRFPVQAGIPMADVIQSGQPLYVSSRQEGQALYPNVFSETTHAAWAVLPLVVEGRTIGGLSFSFPEAHEFSLEEREFGLTLAYQCAQALDRARLYEAEQKARAKAEAAQESIAMLTEMRERHRLAQELHDNVAQVLGYLNIRVGQLHHLFVTNQLDNADMHLLELKQIIGEAYTDIRGEIFNLRSTSSAEEKFLDTLRRYIQKYKRFYRLNIELRLEADEAAFDFPPEVTMPLIRTIQEALMNIRKHAQIDKARLQISCNGQETRIRIEDKGRGFDLTTDNESSFGLKIMRERIEGIGGHLEIDSKVGQGTRITLYFSNTP